MVNLQIVVDRHRNIGVNFLGLRKWFKVPRETKFRAVFGGIRAQIMPANPKTIVSNHRNVFCVIRSYVLNSCKTIVSNHRNSFCVMRPCFEVLQWFHLFGNGQDEQSFRGKENRWMNFCASAVGTRSRQFLRNLFGVNSFFLTPNAKHDSI